MAIGRMWKWQPARPIFRRGRWRLMAQIARRVAESPSRRVAESPSRRVADATRHGDRRYRSLRIAHAGTRARRFRVPLTPRRGRADGVRPLPGNDPTGLAALRRLEPL